jgi:hypothetical protein
MSYVNQLTCTKINLKFYENPIVKRWDLRYNDQEIRWEANWCVNEDKLRKKRKGNK